MPTRLYRRFLLAFFTATLFLLGAVTLVNAAIDPYGLFRLLTRPGLNAAKPAAYTRVRLMKAHDVRRLKPRAVLLGTSRSHLAFRTDHPAWAAQAAPRYNLAFDGATTKEMHAYLVHAHAVQPLQQVLLALDTYHASPAPAAVRPDFDPRLLLDGRPDQHWRVGLSDARLLTSFAMLRDSLRTWRAQRDAEPEWFHPEGQRLGEVFFRRPSENFVQVGPRGYFEEIDRMEVGFKLEWRIPRAGPAAASAAAPAEAATALDYLARIIHFCRAQGIDLRLLITPAHAHQLELDALLGGWPAVEEGKRALVQLLEADARQHPDKRRFPLYDFSGYSTITTEALPPASSRAEMRYYWDSSHFKEAVGDLMLARVLRAEATAAAPLETPGAFGAELTSENLEARLAAIRQAQSAYRAAHPEEIRQLQQWIAAYKQAHGIPEE